jgi:hypothetical protein
MKKKKNFKWFHVREYIKCESEREKNLRNIRSGGELGRLRASYYYFILFLLLFFFFWLSFLRRKRRGSSSSFCVFIHFSRPSKSMMIILGGDLSAVHRGRHERTNEEGSRQ